LQRVLGVPAAGALLGAVKLEVLRLLRALRQIERPGLLGTLRRHGCLLDFAPFRAGTSGAPVAEEGQNRLRSLSSHRSAVPPAEKDNERPSAELRLARSRE
jgi:hypothetical protein